MEEAVKLTTPARTQLNIESLDVVLRSEAAINAQGLILPARLLEGASALERIASKATGCVLIAIIGPRSESAHDLLDDALLRLAVSVESLPATTWHGPDEEGEDVWDMMEQGLIASGAAHRSVVFVTDAPLDGGMTLANAIALIDKELAGVYAPPRL